MYELEVGVGCFKTAVVAAGKALSGVIGKSASGECSESGADESGGTAIVSRTKWYLKCQKYKYIFSTSDSCWSCTKHDIPN